MYEERFRKGLQRVISERCLKQSAVAEKASIRTDTFCRIVNGNRRIFADEMASICNAIGMSVEEVIKQGSDEPKAG